MKGLKELSASVQHNLHLIDQGKTRIIPYSLALHGLA